MVCQCRLPNYSCIEVCKGTPKLRKTEREKEEDTKAVPNAFKLCNEICTQLIHKNVHTYILCKKYVKGLSLSSLSIMIIVIYQHKLKS